MDNWCNTLCILCSSITENNLEKADENTVEIVGVISLNKLQIKRGEAICSTCSGKIQDYVKFKYACVCTEDKLVSFTKGSEQINLNEVYMKKNELDDIIFIPNDLRVCRLCLQSINGDCISFLNVLEHDMIQKYIPEINIFRTVDPVSCEACAVSLRNYANFVNDCLSLKNKNEVYCKEEICFEENMLVENENEVHYELLSAIKTETQLEESENDKKIQGKCFGGFQQSPYINVASLTEKIMKKLSAQQTDFFNSDRLLETDVTVLEKCTEDLNQGRDSDNDPKSTVLYDLDMHVLRRQDNRKTNRATRLHNRKKANANVYLCKQCDYSTKYRNALKSHMFKHTPPSKLKMYNCKKCEYKTKYRNALKSHELNHKAPSEIVMKECNVCSYQTKHRTALVLHMLKHKPPSEIVMYKCDKCKFETKFKHALKPHKLTHKRKTWE